MTVREVSRGTAHPYRAPLRDNVAASNERQGVVGGVTAPFDTGRLHGPEVSTGMSLARSFAGIGTRADGIRRGR